MELITVIITGMLANSSWHLYRKCFVVSLDIDDFTFIAHARQRKCRNGRCAVGSVVCLKNNNHK